MPSDSDPTSPEESGAPDGPPANDDRPDPLVREEPATLVARLIDAGEWPEVGLLERILAAGEGAVAPLLEVLRHPPEGDYGSMAVSHAIGLLGMMHVAEAVPAMVEAARRRWSEASDEASRTAAAFGSAAVAPLLEAIADPDVRGYRRLSLIESAFQAARDDPALHARVTEVAMGLFDQIAAEAREGEALADELVAEADRAANSGDAGDIHGATIEEIDDVDDIEDIDDLEEFADEILLPDDQVSRQDRDRQEEMFNEVIPEEELAHLASCLLRNVGKSAASPIEAAFEVGLIDTSIIDRDDLDRPLPAVEPAPLDGWLEEYRSAYEEHLHYLARVASRRHEPRHATDEPGRDSVDRGRPRAPKVEPTAPIRNTGPRVGRNDPCWCGSGKKFKKCHMSKDSPE
ncbi:preprotein translocase subunit SecA [Aquisphaera giovannonii]|uniref:Preprotein translocase subunit SecA n=1 Tax=Aquisphaera giovannonii TaxID=406548 RepID=A0A5B9WB46_9BACT|nr:SEC-C domain-containing protein [Aquisphaera giovannonii]QEH37464.1 preprotein translocase subunit SecA [Aquisphaera giovannonii]